MVKVTHGRPALEPSPLHVPDTTKHWLFKMSLSCLVANPSIRKTDVPSHLFPKVVAIDCKNAQNLKSPS